MHFSEEFEMGLKGYTELERIQKLLGGSNQKYGLLWPLSHYNHTTDLALYFPSRSLAPSTCVSMHVSCTLQIKKK